MRTATLNDLSPQLGAECTLRDSVLAFIDLTTGAHNRFQENYAISPWIDLVAHDAMLTGKVLACDAYIDMPLLSYFFVMIQVQWYPDTCPESGKIRVSDWVHRGAQYYFGDVPFCTEGTPLFFDLVEGLGQRTMIPPHAEQVRVKIGVLDNCNWMNCEPGQDIDNTSPWIDNVRFGVFDASVSVPEPTTSARPTLLNVTPHPLAAGSRGVIGFSLAEGGLARLDVFDVRGRRVTTLLDTHLPAGPHETVWTGVDDRGRRVPAGVYFYRLTAGGKSQSRKLIVMH